MSAHKLLSPCKSCEWTGDRDRDECFECQPREEYLALLENRPAVNLAAHKKQQAMELRRLIGTATKSYKGNKDPRIKWTDEMLKVAIESRRQGLSLEATAAIVGVGRKGLAKRLRSEGVVI